MNIEQWTELISQTDNGDAMNSLDVFISNNPIQAIQYCIALINSNDFSFPVYAQCFIAIKRAFARTNPNTWKGDMEQLINDLHLALYRGLMFEDITVQNTAANDLGLFCCQLYNYIDTFPPLKQIIDASESEYSIIIKTGVLQALCEIVSSCPVEPDENNSSFFADIIQFCQNTLQKLSSIELEEYRQRIILDSMASFFAVSPSVLNDLPKFNAIFKSLNNCLTLCKEGNTALSIFKCAYNACTLIYSNLRQFYNPELYNLIDKGLRYPNQSMPCLIFLKEMLSNQISKNLTNDFDIAELLMNNFHTSLVSIMESQTDFDLTPDDNEDSPIITLIEVLSGIYSIRNEEYFRIVERYFNENITSSKPNIIYASLAFISTVLLIDEEITYEFFINALQLIQENINPDKYDDSMQLLIHQSCIVISSILTQFPFSQRYIQYDMASFLDIPEYFIGHEDNYIKYSFLIVDAFLQSRYLIKEREEILIRIESLIHSVFSKTDRMLNITYREAVIRSFSTLMSRTYHLSTLYDISKDVVDCITRITASLNETDETYHNSVLLIRDLIRVLIITVKRVKHSLELQSHFPDDFFISLIQKMTTILKKREYLMNDDIISLMIYIISILKFKADEFVKLILPEMIENLKQKENIPSFYSACKAITTLFKTLKQKMEPHSNEIIELLFTSLAESPPFELISPILKCLGIIFKELPFAVKQYSDTYIDILDFYSSSRFDINFIFNENYHGDIKEFIFDCKQFYGGLCDGISGLICFVLYQDDQSESMNVYKIMRKFCIESIKRMQGFIQFPDSKLLVKFGNMINHLSDLNSIKNKIAPLIHRENIQSLIQYALNASDPIIQALYSDLKYKF